MYNMELYVLYVLYMEVYALQSQLVLLVLLLKKESFKTNLAVSNFFLHIFVFYCSACWVFNENNQWNI